MQASGVPIMVTDKAMMPMLMGLILIPHYMHMVHMLVTYSTLSRYIIFITCFHINDTFLFISLQLRITPGEGLVPSPPKPPLCYMMMSLKSYIESLKMIC